MKKLSEQMNSLTLVFCKQIKTKTFRHTFISFSGTIVSSFLGAVFFALLGRSTGPSYFGIFSVLWVFISMIGDMVDLGTNTTMIRYVANFEANKEKKKAWMFLKYAFKIKIIILAVTGLLLIVFSKFLSLILFGKDDFAILFIISGLGFPAVILFNFLTSYFIAYQDFFKASFFNVFNNLIRIIFLTLLILIGYFNLVLGVLIVAFSFGLAFICGFFLMDRRFLSAKEEGKMGGYFWKFNLWMTASFVIAAFHSRLDHFFLARFNWETLGFYAAASRLIAVFPQLAGVLSSVFAPKFSSFRNNYEAKIYFKKTTLFSLGIAFPFLLLALSGKFIIEFFYGKMFLPAVSPFIILLLAHVLFIASVPASSLLLYRFAKVSFFAFLSAGQLLLMAAGNYFLIPFYGASGSALTWLIVNGISFFILNFAAVFSLKKNSKSYVV